MGVRLLASAQNAFNLVEAPDNDGNLWIFSW